MPFESNLQSKACFATGGFGGKVNCKEFADATDYSKLPERAMKKIGTEGAKNAKRKNSSAVRTPYSRS